MKKIVAIFALLVFCFLLCGCENRKEIQFKDNKGLVFCTSDNVSQEVAKVIGKDKKELSSSMEKAGVIFYGIAPDKSFTVSVIKETTEFSQKVLDFSVFNDDELKKIADEISPNYSEYHKNKGETYIVQDTISYSAVGELPARQYITVKNGNFYIFTFTFNKDTVDSIKTKEIMNNISVNTVSKGFSSYGIIVAILILAGISLIIYVVITLIIDIKKVSRNKKTADN